MTFIYKDLIADEQRTRQVIADVTAALSQGRNCLVLTNWTAHLDTLASTLRGLGHNPVILRGGMGAKDRTAALARLKPQPGGPPLLAVATGPYAGEGFDCPALDTLFLASPVAQKGRLVQYAGASSALTAARTRPRSTTTTTSSPASSLHHWPSAHPATPASASPTRGGCHTHRAPTRRPAASTSRHLAAGPARARRTRQGSSADRIRCADGRSLEAGQVGSHCQPQPFSERCQTIRGRWGQFGEVHHA